MKLLLLGGSIIGDGSIADWLEKIGQIIGTPVKVTTCWFPRATLEDHLSNGTAAKLLSKGFDVAILQEQSLRPVLAFELMLAAVKQLEELAKQFGTALYLFQPWRRRDSSSEDWVRMRQALFRSTLNRTGFAGGSNL
jgi:DNA-binding transcriptional LysR family regulator